VGSFLGVGEKSWCVLVTEAVCSGIEKTEHTNALLIHVRYQISACVKQQTYLPSTCQGLMQRESTRGQYAEPEVEKAQVDFAFLCMYYVLRFTHLFHLMVLHGERKPSPPMYTHVPIFHIRASLKKDKIENIRSSSSSFHWTHHYPPIMFMATLFSCPVPPQARVPQVTG